MMRLPSPRHLAGAPSMEAYALLEAAITNLRDVGPGTAVQVANRLRGTGLCVDFNVLSRALTLGVDLEALTVRVGGRQSRGSKGSVKAAAVYSIATVNA